MALQLTSSQCSCVAGLLRALCGSSRSPSLARASTSGRNGAEAAAREAVIIAHAEEVAPTTGDAAPAAEEEVSISQLDDDLTELFTVEATPEATRGDIYCGRTGHQCDALAVALPEPLRPNFTDKAAEVAGCSSTATTLIAQPPHTGEPGIPIAPADAGAGPPRQPEPGVPGELRISLLHAVPHDSRLVGTWLYGPRPARFHISKTQGRGFRFQECVGKGQIVSGILRSRGPWLLATVSFSDGMALGAIRLRLIEDPKGEALICCVKAPGEIEWGTETLAQRKGRWTPQPAGPEESLRPRGPLLWTSWWQVGTACCAAQFRLEVDFAFIMVAEEGANPERLAGPLHELRAGLGTEPIVAFTECRHPLSPPLMTTSSSVWLDHTFVFLEVGVKAAWALCLEKLSDKLEVMAGRREAVRAYAEKHRATGQKRPIAQDLPIDERPSLQLPSEALVSDLCDWIEGPLAMSWRPYHPVDANGQHLAIELRAFLKRRDSPPLHGLALSFVDTASNLEHANSCRELTLKAVQRDSSELSRVAPEFQADPEIVAAALQRDGNMLQHASPDLRATRALVLQAVERSGSALKFASAELRADADVVRHALHKDGDALQFASEELRGNQILVRAAMLRTVGALRWASDELRHNRRFLLSVVRRDGRALRFLPEAMRADREVVTAAVRQHGLALECAADWLSADRDVVTTAVQQCGMALRFAAAELQADQAVTLAAVQQDWQALTHAAPAMAADPEIILAAMRKYWGAFQLAAPELKSNREMVLRCLQKDWRVLMFASKELRADREVTLAAVRRHGLALQLASQQLQEDREMVLAAVQEDATALSFATAELKADREIIMTAVSRHWSALKHASPELQADYEIAAAAVRQSARAFEHVAPELRSDLGLWLLTEKGEEPQHSSLTTVDGAVIPEDLPFELAQALSCAHRTEGAMDGRQEVLNSAPMAADFPRPMLTVGTAVSWQTKMAQGTKKVRVDQHGSIEIVRGYYD